jgi:hypothetical protein
MLYPPPRVFFVLILIEPFKYTLYDFFGPLNGCAYNTMGSVGILLYKLLHVLNTDILFNWKSPSLVV